jgi:hypothetical protein
VKLFILSIALIANAASAQIVSGSIVVINFTKNQIIVAADSRGIINSNTGLPDDSYCKVSAFRNQFIFSSTGGSRLINSTPSDKIPSWDNNDLAREAIDGIAEGVEGNNMATITRDWGVSVSRRWIPLCEAHRDTCANLAAHSHGVLTEGIFYRIKDLSVAGAIVSFDTSAPSDPVRCNIFQADLTKCWPCGQTHGERICVAGDHFDVAEKVCSERKQGASIPVRTQLRGAVTQKTKLPVQLVEMTIDAYSKNGGNVGGPVDTVTITKSGIIWNSLKKNCPKN